METLTYYWGIVYPFLNKNPHILLLVIILTVISSTALCFFYFKSKQPAFHALIPVWNLVVFLRIVGRPWWHVFFFLIPIYNIFFGFVLIVELNKSFGKFGFFPNLMAILFNALYVIYLGFSGEKYYAPSYRKSKEEILNA